MMSGPDLCWAAVCHSNGAWIILPLSGFAPSLGLSHRIPTKNIQLLHRWLLKKRNCFLSLSNRDIVINVEGVNHDTDEKQEKVAFSMPRLLV